MRLPSILILPLLTLSAATAALPVKQAPLPADEPAPVTAPKPLTGESQEKLLAQLKEIGSSLHDKHRSYNLTLLPRLQDAGNNDDKAFSLWLDATKQIDFENQGKSATEFSDFRNGKAKTLRSDASFTGQLRLQCRFLSLIILQADAQSDSERTALITAANAYLDDYIASAKKLGGRQDELRRSALDSAIAKHLKLDVTARRDKGPAAYTPGSLGEIYNQMILPFHRERRNAPAINSAWTKRISQETTLAELAKIPEQLEIFEKERLPELKWAQARDLYDVGQEEPAAASMVAIIKSNLAHRNTPGWIQELAGLIKESPKSETISARQS